MAFCAECGNKLADSQKFCANCGTPAGGAAMPRTALAGQVKNARPAVPKWNRLR